MTNLNKIEPHLAGTSTEKFLQMQNNANNAYFTNKHNNQIETIDLDTDEYDSLLYDSSSEDIPSLGMSIAVTADGAQNGEFVTITDDYWTDNPLKFEIDENTGSYKVLQQDENGNWVPMG